MIIVERSQPYNIAQLELIANDPRVASTYFRSGSAGNNSFMKSVSQRGVEIWVARLAPHEPVIGAVIVFQQRELSFFVTPNLWGQGVGRSMVQRVCAILKTNTGKNTKVDINARVIRENIASIKILESAGFTFAGLYPPAIESRRPQPASIRFRLIDN